MISSVLTTREETLSLASSSTWMGAYERDLQSLAYNIYSVSD